MISFKEFCTTLEGIAGTTKRLEIQEVLSAFLEKLLLEDPKSLGAALFLATASIHPQFRGVELGVGEHLMQMLVCEATGMSLKNVQSRFVETGDLGIIAANHRVAQLFIHQKGLGLRDVLEQMREVARESGKNSKGAKKKAMLRLINAASALETKYLIRLFEGKLKVGLALQTVLISTGIACQRIAAGRSGDEPALSTAEAVERVKEAYNKQPDFDGLAALLLEHGIGHLHEVCSITPGVPLKPMLAQPAKNLTAAFAKVVDADFAAEFKYDGERVQLHYDGKTTRIFSRNSEDISIKYPDLAALRLNGRPFIIDGEVVAYGDSKILPFQVLSTRKRKLVDKIDVEVCVFVFDILFYDGEELLDRPLRQRAALLREHFTEQPGRFHFVSTLTCRCVEDIDAQFKAAIQNSCEGVMLKSLESPYRPSLRTNSWVKVKSDYLDALGDSLDLVVMGAFYGKGRRTGAFGGFLLGAYNDELDKFEACCKIGTGFSDELLQTLYIQLSEITTADTSQYLYKSGVCPDVWVQPKYVWEVKAASLSLSPVYSAGACEGKGISLRFPRFIRFRGDKEVKQATTSNQMVRMFFDNVENEDGDEDEFN